MTLEYDNIFDATSDSTKQAELDQRRSDLMISIHAKLDLKGTPIKNAVGTLGVTPAQARKLAKGQIDNFSVFELQTFLTRIC